VRRFVAPRADKVFSEYTVSKAESVPSWSLGYCCGVTLMLSCVQRVHAYVHTGTTYLARSAA
jgi:aspartate/methionine/tyrosine aminotransferase